MVTDKVDRNIDVLLWVRLVGLQGESQNLDLVCGLKSELRSSVSMINRAHSAVGVVSW